MLSHEERAACVRWRVAEETRRRRLRRERMTAAAAAAVCLMLIVGLGAAMPGMLRRMEDGNCAGPAGTASMFGGSGAIGYVVIGVLAFVLGVCVTVLCFRLRRLHGEEKETGEDGTAE